MPDLNDLDAPSNRAIDEMLASTGVERARIIAPFVLLGVASSLAMSESVGVGLSAPVVAYNALAVLALGALSVALSRRKIADRWGHLVMTALWAVPVGGTLISQYFSGVSNLHVLLAVEICATAIQLHTVYVMCAVASATAAAAPLLFRDSPQDAPVYVGAMLAGAVFAILMHLLMKRSLVRAETHRLSAAAAARELAQRLAELEAAARERAQLQDQLLHSQRMEAIGTLAAGLAHDMNNVLAAITSFAGLLVDEVASSPARSDVDQIITQAERGAGLTRALLAFSRRGQYRKSVVAIGTLVGEVIPLLARTLPKSIEIRQRLGGTVDVEGDPVQLEQILVNLGLNAADAMSGTGTLSIDVDEASLSTEAGAALGISSGRYARIRVGDTGCGMDEATRRRVFEPFFTTKPLGRGTGLGLSTVWGIVQAHHGAVAVESAPGEGATFTVYLPATLAAPTRRTKEEPSAAPTTRTGRVLIADDEPAVRAGTKRVLEKMGLEVFTAGNGAEALEVFESAGDTIGLVILDMGMPVLGGAECFRRLRHKSCVPILIATGYALEAEVQDLVARGASLIEKPYPARDLAREVARLLDLPATDQSRLRHHP